jgi:hypothetical protein
LENIVIYTTLERIRAHSPCTSGWKNLLVHLGKTTDDAQPLALVTILDSNGIDDTLWCLRAEPQHASIWRLYAVRCARRVQHLMEDPHSLAALDVAERYAAGMATDAELSAAGGAARAAAGAAAGGAARAAAGAAARAAAWDAAGAAAWDAAGAAAGAAARDAAGAAAGAAAWDAAGAAAGAAAWDAARAAAWDAAGAAAWDAAGAAAGAAQADDLREVLNRYEAAPGAEARSTS